jgi:hypothetical protein
MRPFTEVFMPPLARLTWSLYSSPPSFTNAGKHRAVPYHNATDTNNRKLKKYLGRRGSYDSQNSMYKVKIEQQLEILLPIIEISYTVEHPVSERRNIT